MRITNLSVKEIEQLQAYRGYIFEDGHNWVALYNKYGNFITKIGFDEHVNVYKAKLLFMTLIDERVIKVA